MPNSVPLPLRVDLEPNIANNVVSLGATVNFKIISTDLTQTTEEILNNEEIEWVIYKKAEGAGQTIWTQVVSFSSADYDFDYSFSTDAGFEENDYRITASYIRDAEFVVYVFQYETTFQLQQKTSPPVFNDFIVTPINGYAPVNVQFITIPSDGTFITAAEGNTIAAIGWSYRAVGSTNWTPLDSSKVTDLDGNAIDWELENRNSSFMYPFSNVDTYEIRLTTTIKDDETNETESYEYIYSENLVVSNLPTLECTFDVFPDAPYKVNQNLYLFARLKNGFPVDRIKVGNDIGHVTWIDPLKLSTNPTGVSQHISTPYKISFPKKGNYVVTLKVTDTNGNSATFNQVFKIYPGAERKEYKVYVGPTPEVKKIKTASTTRKLKAIVDYVDFPPEDLPDPVPGTTYDPHPWKMTGNTGYFAIKIKTDVEEKFDDEYTAYQVNNFNAYEVINGQEALHGAYAQIYRNGVVHKFRIHTDWSNDTLQRNWLICTGIPTGKIEPGDVLIIDLDDLNPVLSPDQGGIQHNIYAQRLGQFDITYFRPIYTGITPDLDFYTRPVAPVNGGYRERDQTAMYTLYGYFWVPEDSEYEFMVRMEGGPNVIGHFFINGQRINQPLNSNTIDYLLTRPENGYAQVDFILNRRAILKKGWNRLWINGSINNISAIANCKILCRFRSTDPTKPAIHLMSGRKPALEPHLFPIGGALGGAVTERQFRDILFDTLAEAHASSSLYFAPRNWPEAGKVTSVRAVSRFGKPVIELTVPKRLSKFSNGMESFSVYDLVSNPADMPESGGIKPRGCIFSTPQVDDAAVIRLGVGEKYTFKDLNWGNTVVKEGLAKHPIILYAQNNQNPNLNFMGRLAPLLPSGDHFTNFDFTQWPWSPNLSLLKRDEYKNSTKGDYRFFVLSYGAANESGKLEYSVEHIHHIKPFDIDTLKFRRRQDKETRFLNNEDSDLFTNYTSTDIPWGRGDIINRTLGSRQLKDKKSWRTSYFDTVKVHEKVFTYEEVGSLFLEASTTPLQAGRLTDSQPYVDERGDYNEYDADLITSSISGVGQIVFYFDTSSAVMGGATPSTSSFFHSTFNTANRDNIIGFIYLQQNTTQFKVITDKSTGSYSAAEATWTDKNGAVALITSLFAHAQAGQYSNIRTGTGNRYNTTITAITNTFNSPYNRYIYMFGCDISGDGAFDTTTKNVLLSKNVTLNSFLVYPYNGTSGWLEEAADYTAGQYFGQYDNGVSSSLLSDLVAGETFKSSITLNQKRWIRYAMFNSMDNVYSNYGKIDTSTGTPVYTINNYSIHGGIGGAVVGSNVRLSVNSEHMVSSTIDLIRPISKDNRYVVFAKENKLYLYDQYLLRDFGPYYFNDLPEDNVVAKEQIINLDKVGDIVTQYTPDNSSFVQVDSQNRKLLKRFPLCSKIFGGSKMVINLDDERAKTSWRVVTGTLGYVPSTGRQSIIDCRTVNAGVDVVPSPPRDGQLRAAVFDNIAYFTSETTCGITSLGSNSFYYQVDGETGAITESFYGSFKVPVDDFSSITSDNSVAVRLNPENEKQTITIKGEYNEVPFISASSIILADLVKPTINGGVDKIAVSDSNPASCDVTIDFVVREWIPDKIMVCGTQLKDEQSYINFFHNQAGESDTYLSDLNNYSYKVQLKRNLRDFWKSSSTGKIISGSHLITIGLENHPTGKREYGYRANYEQNNKLELTENFSSRLIVFNESDIETALLNLDARSNNLKVRTSVKAFIFNAGTNMFYNPTEDTTTIPINLTGLETPSLPVSSNAAAQSEAANRFAGCTLLALDPITSSHDRHLISRSSDTGIVLQGNLVEELTGKQIAIGAFLPESIQLRNSRGEFTATETLTVKDFTVDKVNYNDILYQASDTVLYVQYFDNPSTFSHIVKKKVNIVQLNEGSGIIVQQENKTYVELGFYRKYDPETQIFSQPYLVGERGSGPRIIQFGKLLYFDGEIMDVFIRIKSSKPLKVAKSGINAKDIVLSIVEADTGIAVLGSPFSKSNEKITPIGGNIIETSEEITSDTWKVEIISPIFESDYNAEFKITLTAYDINDNLVELD